MKKLFLMFSFILLSTTNIFGQPMVDIPLYATDGTYTIPLSVGLDPSATIGIDPQLGESDLPPFPPYPAFEIRFDLQPFIGEPLSTYKDYRYAISPFWGGYVDHLLWSQVGDYGNPLEIQYELPYYVWMSIKDWYTGGEIVNLGPLYGTGTAEIPYPWSYVFNRFLLTMHYDWIPVELTSFSASVLQNENAIQLNWSTATETNNQGFEIQRLQDSKIEKLNDWKAIGFVPGFGTTTEPKSYSFIDESITTGTYKYRLKQIDFDGSFEYSNEIEVEVDFTPKEFVLYQNYPNPFNPSTTIKFEIPSVIASRAKQSQLVTLRVYDVLGNEIATLVNEEKQPGVYEVEFGYQVSHSGEVWNLMSGVYFYQLKAGTFIHTKKMILAK